MSKIPIKILNITNKDDNIDLSLNCNKERIMKNDSNLSISYTFASKHKPKKNLSELSQALKDNLLRRKNKKTLISNLNHK